MAENIEVVKMAEQKRPTALVLTGYGINCDFETQAALNAAGFLAERVHVNDILARKASLSDYSLLAFPGGFSYGDDLGAGKGMANKLVFAKLNSHSFREELQKFIDEKKLVLGICNGFQMMVKLGIVPALGGKYFEQQSTLFANDSGRFEDRWVGLNVNEKSPCIFTRGIETLELPVRHGEGKFIPASAEVLKALEAENLVAMRYADKDFNITNSYPENPNGSVNAIAGVCDETGRVFGLMPHPEGHVSFYQHPHWARVKNELLRKGLSVPEKGAGMKIFENAFAYCAGKL